MKSFTSLFWQFLTLWEALSYLTKSRTWLSDWTGRNCLFPVYFQLLSFPPEYLLSASSKPLTVSGDGDGKCLYYKELMF